MKITFRILAALFFWHGMRPLDWAEKVLTNEDASIVSLVFLVVSVIAWTISDYSGPAPKGDTRP